MRTFSQLTPPLRSYKINIWQIRKLSAQKKRYTRGPDQVILADIHLTIWHLGYLVSGELCGNWKREVGQINNNVIIQNFTDQAEFGIIFQIVDGSRLREVRLVLLRVDKVRTSFCCCWCVSSCRCCLLIFFLLRSWLVDCLGRYLVCMFTGYLVGQLIYLLIGWLVDWLIYWLVT